MFSPMVLENQVTHKHGERIELIEAEYLFGSHGTIAIVGVPANDHVYQIFVQITAKLKII